MPPADHRRTQPPQSESEPSSWLRKKWDEFWDKFWNSVIPGRPTLAKIVVLGTIFITIALVLGIALFIYVYRKVHPEYNALMNDLLQGKRIFKSESQIGLYSLMMPQEPVVLQKHQNARRKRDIEEVGDYEDQNAHPSNNWFMAASQYFLEDEQENGEESMEEESREESTYEEFKKKINPKNAIKNYKAKMKELKSKIKDKNVAIQMQVKNAMKAKNIKEAKTILAKKTKNIKEAKNIIVEKAKNIKKAKKVSKKAKNTKVQKIKGQKHRKK
ncbi:uncharacterized protein LOC130293610 isoform X2 [Hyla sarda]|uniref:uncharacterized protein LOC130293610 isoform X2 n=1 Tax=Hyla sarda TaxID=327740 RepID=UPI0024C2FC62|nr:uncharacterized protein LOC130293610 isoform X2 [Hyla sarda]